MPFHQLHIILQLVISNVLCYDFYELEVICPIVLISALVIHRKPPITLSQKFNTKG